MSHQFDTFAEFWPHYVRAHSKKSTRLLHLLGTTAALSSAGVGFFTRRLGFVLAAPLLGYGPAWFGHFFFEGNVPATFGHPLWSLKADFVMMSKMLDGTMDAEVERVMRAEQSEADEDAPATRPRPQTMPRINVTHEPSGVVN